MSAYILKGTSNLAGKCTRVLSSIGSDKDEINACLDAGAELTNIDCDKVLKPGNITNGYMFSKCAKERGLQMMKFVDPKGNNGFVYVDGLNKDTKPFRPYGTCKAGGLYFAEKKYILDYSNFGSQLCKVTIPPHAQVYNEKDSDGSSKHKATEIIVDLDNHTTATEYVKSLSRDEVKKLSEKQIVRYANDINPDFIDDSIVEIILNSVNEQKYTGKIGDLIEKKIRSFTPEQLCEKIINDNKYILTHLFHDMLTEDFCELLCKSAYASFAKTNDMMTKKFIRWYLSNQMVKTMDINKDAYSRDFLAHLLINYDMLEIIMPERYVTQDTFDHFCKSDAGIRIVFSDPRFENFLTKEFCIDAFKKNIVHYRSVPPQFRTDAMYDRFCTSMFSDDE